MKIVYFGCGCFWGTEAYFKTLTGVVNSVVGYSDGFISNPSYEQVCEGGTGHYEVCRLEYDESKITFVELLNHFFKVINPTNRFGQAMDIGKQYMSVIIYTETNQFEEAKSYIEKLQKKYDKPITTALKPFKNFFLAEEYHQNYLDKNPSGYCHIQIPEKS